MINDQIAAEKIAFLDARDKLLRQQIISKQTELNKVRSFTGSCTDMCPERERYLRTKYLSIFERDELNQPDEYAMVKEYRRAGADQEEPLPHELRTPKALEITMDYLVCRIMDDPRSSAPDLALDWYDFLWDRLRAIRKDITQQNICDPSSAILVERCTRFHIHSCYAMNRAKDFDVDMNKKNLNDCLQMLRQMYNDLRTTGVVCPGELEFQKYDILLHLNEDLLSTNVLMKSSDHRNSEDMKFITQIFNSYMNHDYYKFFKLMEQADYMTSCILSLYVNKVRFTAIKIILTTCTSRGITMYPCDLAINLLGFDGLEDLRMFATKLDIEIQEKSDKYYLLLNKDYISLLRQAEASLLPLKSSRLVENKKFDRKVGHLVYGSDELPVNPYKSTPLNVAAFDSSIKIEPVFDMTEDLSRNTSFRFTTDTQEYMGSVEDYPIEIDEHDEVGYQEVGLEEEEEYQENEYREGKYQEDEYREDEYQEDEDQVYDDKEDRNSDICQVDDDENRTHQEANEYRKTESKEDDYPNNIECEHRGDDDMDDTEYEEVHPADTSIEERMDVRDSRPRDSSSRSVNSPEKSEEMILDGAILSTSQQVENINEVKRSLEVALVSSNKVNEVVADENDDDEDDDQSLVFNIPIPKPKSYAEISKMMPAGREKRYSRNGTVSRMDAGVGARASDRISKPTAQSLIYQAISHRKSPLKKPTTHESTIEAIKKSIQGEAKANSSLRELVRMFI